MDLDQIDPIVFQKMEKERNENVLSDPHFYLCLVFMGIMLVMSLFACSHTEPLPSVDGPKQEPGFIHK